MGFAHEDKVCDKQPDEYASQQDEHVQKALRVVSTPVAVRVGDGQLQGEHRDEPGGSEQHSS